MMKATLFLASAALIAGSAIAQTGGPGNSAAGGTGSQAASDFNVPKAGVRSTTGDTAAQQQSGSATANRDSSAVSKPKTVSIPEMLPGPHGGERAGAG